MLAVKGFLHMKKERSYFKRHPRLYWLFMRPTCDERLLFLRYIFPGLIGILTDLALLVLLTEIVSCLSDDPAVRHLAVYVATGVAFTCGVLVNAALSRRFVFHHMTCRAHSTAGEITGHFLIGTVGLLFTEVLMWGGLQIGFHYAAAKLLASFLVFFWNYCARRWFLYKQRHHHSRSK